MALPSSPNSPGGPGPLASPTAVRFRIALTGITVVAVAMALLVRLVDEATAKGAAASAINVDFSKTVATVPASDIGATISGYGGDTTVANSEVHQKLLKSLGLGLARIELKFSEPGKPESKVICNSLGCNKDIAGADWLKGIKAIGAEPLLVLPTDPDHSVETDVKDAVNLAKFAVEQGVPITRFVVGNEPDHGGEGNQKPLNADEYTKRFNAIADALHAANADYKVGGPTLANAVDQDQVTGFTDAFLKGAGAKLDFFDFHHYAQCGTEVREEELLSGGVTAYASHIRKVKSRIKELVPARADKIGIQIGEYNVSCNRKDEIPLEHTTTLWGAAALGTILETDATAVQFSDRNEGLGLVNENGQGGYEKNTPQPIYHGIGMFTGEGLFRRFGTKMVHAEADNDELYVFASTEAKNVVLVNTGKTEMDATLSLLGLAPAETKAEVWQSTGEKMVPHKTGDLPIENDKATVKLPARSVTTLVIDPGATGQPGSSTTTTAAPSATTSTTAPAGSTTTTPAGTVTTTTVVAPPADGAGLTAEYFDNADLTGKSHSRVEPRVYLDYEHAPFEDFEADTWSVRWTGSINIDALGTYTFTTTSDDGVRLYIDDTVIIDKWEGHTIRDDSGQAALTAGWHTIRLEFHDETEIAFLKLAWEGPNLPREVIPTDHLKPAVGSQ